MSIAFVRPGIAMRAGAGGLVLAAPLRSTGGAAAGSGAGLSGISGLSGWWDASDPFALLDSAGNPVAGWNSPVGVFADKSGQGRPLAPYSAAPLSAPAVATPRLNGLLGGVGRVAGGGALVPALDPDLGFQSAGRNLSADTAWTLLLVWSR